MLNAIQGNCKGAVLGDRLRRLQRVLPIKHTHIGQLDGVAVGKLGFYQHRLTIYRSKYNQLMRRGCDRGGGA